MPTPRLFFLALCACACLTGGTSASARTIKVCVSDRPGPPNTFPDHEGLGQVLLRAAIERQGDNQETTVAPWTRCLAMVRLGLLDAVINPTAVKVNLDNMAFPMKDGAPDPARAFGSATWQVVRRRGDDTDWDGVNFKGLTTAVIYNNGHLAVRDRLQAVSLAADDSAKTSTQILTMLVLKRAQIGILRTSDIDAYLIGDFKEKLERLPTPFLSLPVYVTFSHQFYQKNAAYVERIWSDIATHRAEQTRLLGIGAH